MSVPGILIGGNGPIQLDRAAIAARLAAPRVGERCGRAGVDVARMVDEYLVAPAVYRPDFPRPALGEVNTDLFRRDEFDLGLQRR